MKLDPNTCTRSVRGQLHPLLLAMLAGLPGLAHAGTCIVNTPGASTCPIPGAVASVNVVATGGGGGGGVSGGGAGGAGSVVTATLVGVGGTALNLFVGGGGGAGGGGGSSNVNSGTGSQIIAGGGGGGGGGAGGGTGGNANGASGTNGAGTTGTAGVGSTGGGGGAGGGTGSKCSSACGGSGGSGNGGAGGSGGVGSGGGAGGAGGSAGSVSGGGGGGGYGGGGGGNGGATTGSKCGGSGGTGGICAAGGGGGGGGSVGGAISLASNAGASGGSGGAGSIVVTWVDPPNTAPSFIGANPSTLTVAENAGATDAASLMHISDIDGSQTETWTQWSAPSHGSLSTAGANVNSGLGSTNISPPAGTITYTPTPGYAGADSFAVTVGDGAAFAVTPMTVNVTVSNATVSVSNSSLGTMIVGTAYSGQGFVASGGFAPYAYSVSAGALPGGLALNAGTGALTGTPTTAGPYNFTIQAIDSSTGTGPFSGTRAFTGTVFPVGTVPPPTGNLSTLTPPALVGLTTSLSVKDLSSAGGPAMTTCLTNALSALIGIPATYLGQRADGGASFSVAASPAYTLSFYPVDANAGGGNPALQASNTNLLTVSTSCATFTMAPAMFNIIEFAALANTIGLPLNLNAQGVFTGQLGSNIFVVRPDYVVTKGVAGAPSLLQGADGLYRFKDSAGNTQIMRPAFLSPGALQIGAGAGLGGNVLIQIDGTALFTQFNGAQSVLVPDMVLGPIPAAFAQSSWWADGANRFRYPIGFVSQGLTQTAK